MEQQQHLPGVSRIWKSPMQGNDIASILVECIVFPALINKRFDFRLRVVKFDSFSHFSRSIGILRWRNNSFSMVFRIIFPSGIMKKTTLNYFFFQEIQIESLSSSERRQYQTFFCSFEKLVFFC